MQLDNFLINQIELLLELRFRGRKNSCIRAFDPSPSPEKSSVELLNRSGAGLRAEPRLDPPLVAFNLDSFMNAVAEAMYCNIMLKNLKAN